MFFKLELRSATHYEFWYLYEMRAYLICIVLYSRFFR